MVSPGVTWYGTFNWTGYGEVSKNVVLSLDHLGVDVRPVAAGSAPSWTNTEDWGPLRSLAGKPPHGRKISIAHLNPNERVPRGAYNIRYTVWEATLLPPHWAEVLNREDEVWVPSNFCRETFKASGVRKPLFVMPHGVNLWHFNPREKPLVEDPRFTFLFIGDRLPRKGLDLFLKAFNEEFSQDEPVKALVKLHGGTCTEAPNLQVISRILPLRELPSLYRSAKCLVISSRGEGYGMCALEALACGITVIYTNWGGQVDFLSSRVAYPVSYQLVPVRDMPYDYESVWGRAQWAEIDHVDLRRTMRHVYEHCAEAQVRTRAGLKMVWKHYSWLQVAKQIRERLSEIGV